MKQPPTVFRGNYTLDCHITNRLRFVLAIGTYSLSIANTSASINYYGNRCSYYGLPTYPTTF